jgi:tRNA-dihydrouridine synthase C
MLSKKWPVDFSKPLLLLAPMEGVVDAVNRELITSLGATDLCVTEFVRVVSTLLPPRVFHQYCPELQQQSKTQAGTPVLLQLLGSDCSAMAENAARAVELGAAGIDLNFGCPAKSVNRNDGGAALLKTPERIFNVVTAVRKAVPATHSVSAKIRLGFDHPHDALTIAQAAEAAGASWLVVHARTKMDGYKPPAYWEHIRPIKEKLQIPVIANGEVWTPNDYQRCRQISGCEHVMIGRGWVANPGLGQQIKNGKAKTDWLQWQKYFLKFVDDSMAYRNESYAIQRAKQLAKIMGQSYSEANELLQKIKTFQEITPLKECLTHDFAAATTAAPSQLIVANKLNRPAAASTPIEHNF